MLQHLTTDVRECRMVHLCRTHGAALMLTVTLDATADVRVERRRLALKHGRIVGVTDNATGSLDAFDGRVAGVAVVIEESVCL